MDNLFASLESKYGLPEGLLSAVKSAEGSKDDSVSPKGAKGTFQFMPQTAEAYGVDTSDPISSATGAAKFLSDLKKQYGGNITAAIAHYNGGSKAGQAVAKGEDVPFDETKNYITKVTSNLAVPKDLQWENLTTSEVPKDLQFEPITKETKVDQPKMSNLELFGKGALASAKDTLLGAKQLYNLGEKAVGAKTAKEHQQQIEEEIRKQREENAPILNTPAGFAGNLTGEVIKAVPTMFIPGAGEVKGAALIGGALGALQPTTEDESKLFNIGAGGALGGAGQAVAKGISKVAQPFETFLSDAGKKAVQVLEDHGIPLDAAQKTGSKFLESVKAHLSDNPVTTDTQAAFKATQQKAYNKAIAKTIGEDADAITPDVLAKAKERLGSNYDDIASRNNIDVKHLNAPINSLYTEAKKILNPTQLNTLDKNIEDIFSKARTNKGSIDFDQYKNVKKTLDRLSSSSDTDLANYGRELKDILKQGLTKSAEVNGNEADVKLLKETNKQYGNMKKIEDIVLNNPEGDVSPARLLNSLATKSKRNAFFAEDKTLADLATAGKQVLTEKVPNSGTTKRLLSAAVPASLGALGGGLYQGDLSGAAEGAIGGVLLPKMAQKMINSLQAAQYLSQGLPKGMIGTPIRSLLNAPKKGGQLVPQAAMNAYLQSLPPEARKQ
jgi:hypothetical protein